MDQFRGIAVREELSSRGIDDPTRDQLVDFIVEHGKAAILQADF